MNEATPRIAIVTGASRGIGRAIAERLASDGFAVGVHYGRDAAAAEETAAAIDGIGGTAFAFRADLSADGAGQRFWAAFDAATAGMPLTGKPVHALVNKAGVNIRGSIDDLDQEGFAAQQAVNVAAPYFLVKDGLPRIADEGRIVNISSAATRIAMPDAIQYGMTKAAIDAFTRTLAKHLGPRAITVNAVAPGAIDTELNASWMTQELRDHIADFSALGRIGQPEDIAAIVSFLVSPDSGWITGQTIDATGGAGL